MDLTQDQIKRSILRDEIDPRKTAVSKFDDDAVERDLFKKLRLGIDQWHMIDFRGDGNIEDYVPMRILSIKEIEQIERKASAYFAKLPENERVLDVAARHRAQLTIQACLSSAPGAVDNAHFYNDETISRLPERALQRILEKYSQLCMDYDPCLDKLTDDEILQLIEEVKKKLDLVSNLSRSRLEQAFLKCLSDLTPLTDRLHMLSSQRSSM